MGYSKNSLLKIFATNKLSKSFDSWWHHEESQQKDENL